tara:strand:- start:1752 stop:2354 length:603 start_codon:yes stop_codon:yes gene_type:complete
MKSSEMINKIRTLLDLQIKLEQRKLDNGTVLEAEAFSQGNEVFIKTEDEKVAMPIGEYTLEDGQVLLVKEEGIIADLKASSKEEPETEEEEMRDDGEEAAVDDWEGMEKRIKNLEDAVADLKKDKEPRSEETKDSKDIEVDAEQSGQIKSRTVKEEFSQPAAAAIKHSPEGNFKKEADFQFSNKRPMSILDSVMEKITNN